MAIRKAKESKSWPFATKAEALKKLDSLKDKATYEIVRNREADGRLAKGWILRKSK